MAKMRWFCSVGLTAVTLHVCAATVWAQKNAPVPDEEDGWLKWAVAAGLAVVICVTGFLNAKRSHLT